MKTGQPGAYNERMARLKKALALEIPDRVPITLQGPSFIKYANPDAKLSDYITRPHWADEQVLKSYMLPVLDEIDGAPSVGFPIALLGAGWFCQMKLPGRDLPDDDMWQICEKPIMTLDDYDTILDKGWKAFSKELTRRAGYDPADLEPDLEYMASIQQKVKEMGLVSMFSGGPGFIPSFEILSSVRGIAQFFRDLRKIPDKVVAVIEVMDNDMLNDLVPQIEKTESLFCTLAGTRTGSDLISRQYFEKFYWPTIKRFADLVVSKGSNVWLHMDSNWEGFLPYFRELPKGRCVFDPDSLTNIYKIKEVLGDMMCITGDVPPALLALGTPDEVYEYATKLVKEIGPGGFIQNSGCTVPPNTPLENIKAVVYSVIGK